MQFLSSCLVLLRTEKSSVWIEIPCMNMMECLSMRIFTPVLWSSHTRKTFFSIYFYKRNNFPTNQQIRRNWKKISRLTEDYKYNYFLIVFTVHLSQPIVFPRFIFYNFFFSFLFSSSPLASRHSQLNGCNIFHYSVCDFFSVKRKFSRPFLCEGERYIERKGEKKPPLRHHHHMYLSVSIQLPRHTVENKHKKRNIFRTFFFVTKESLRELCWRIGEKYF